MENATKALLISAGILFAIVILSLAIIVYGNISGYYQAKESSISQEQLANFNIQYSVYNNRDDVTGFELVSLINKMINFNEMKIEEGYSKMTLTIEIPKDTKQTYEGALFKQPDTISYTDGTKNNPLKSNIESMQRLENKYTAAALSKLEANMDYLSGYTPSVKDTRSEKKLEDVLGKGYSKLTEENYNTKLPRATLLKYRDYLTFKRANFRCTKVEYNNFGQIYNLEFEQI